MYDLNILITQ